MRLKSDFWGWIFPEVFFSGVELRWQRAPEPVSGWERTRKEVFSVMKQKLRRAGPASALTGRSERSVQPVAALWPKPARHQRNCHCCHQPSQLTATSTRATNRRACRTSVAGRRTICLSSVGTVQR